MVKFNKIGTSEEGNYSVYENPDKELVEKIKQVKIDENLDLYYDNHNGFFRGNKRHFLVTSKLSDTQILCQFQDGDKDCFTLKVDFLEELKIELLKQKINKLYPMSEYAFFKNLVYKMHESEEYFESNKITLITDGMVGGDSQTLWITTYVGSNNINSTWRKGIEYKRDNGGHVFFSYFDFDGNYNVRDYNMNFNNVIQENILTEDEIISKCLESLYELEKPTELEYYGSAWYTDEFKYWLTDEDHDGVKIHITPKSSVDSKLNVFYKDSNTRSMKKPSKRNLVKVDFEHMANAFRNRIIKTYEITKE